MKKLTLSEGADPFPEDMGRWLNTDRVSPRAKEKKVLKGSVEKGFPSGSPWRGGTYPPSNYRNEVE